MPADALLTGIAVLTLLSALSDEQPLLVAVDDAQLLDRASLDTVAFAASKQSSSCCWPAPAGNVPPAGFQRDPPATAAATADPAGRRTAPGRTTTATARPAPRTGPCPSGRQPIGADRTGEAEADTLIAGHRDPLAADDDAQRQIDESRRYLADFETALERSSTPPDLIDRMTATYPDLANPYTLWVAAYDLLGSRT